MICRFLVPFVSVVSILSALPKGSEVVIGQAEFQASKNSLQIKTSDKTIINYQAFDIGEKERVEFVQPSSKSTVLNRVQGKNASRILGNLDGNGRVFLVNPQGIYFGPNAVVNTGSFIASTLNIRDEDFLNDHFHFFLEPGSEKSQILNQGMIAASPEGFIAFFAPMIENRGVIRAKAGKVVLAAAEHVTLDFYGDGLLQFKVDGELKKALIENYGQIEAASGSVELSMRTARDAIKMVVNTDGITPANAIEEVNGIIRLVSKSQIAANQVHIDGTNLEIQGSIDASKRSAGEKGGTIHALGDQVQLRGGLLDVSGDLGGGEILIGGDYQGKGDVRTANNSVMDPTSLILADAYTEGDGGKVILWSDDTTLFNGKIFARGGAQGGNGGFVETSGKENLGCEWGFVNTSAAKGNFGNWLLDPNTITIANAGAGTIAQASAPNCATGGGVNLSVATMQAAATNVALCATNSATSTITINNAFTMAAGVSLSMTAGSANAGTININANITTQGQPLSFTGLTRIGANVTLDTTNAGGSPAGSNISFSNTLNGNGARTLALNGGTGGTITMTGAVGGTTALTSLTATAATITQSSTAITTGALSYTGSTAINVNGNVTTTGGAGGTVTIAGAGLATIPGTTITTSGGAISVTAPVSITGSPLFDTTNAGGTAAGANISFSNTLNGAASPTFRAGTGGITSFTGVVGGTVAPTNLTFTNPASHVTNQIQIGNNITVSGANPLTFPSLIPVTITGTSTITSNNANVNFNTTVDGAQALTIAGGSGTVTFTGAVGGTTALTSLTTTAATITQSSTARTTGALSYTGSTATNVNGNVTTTGGAGGTVTIAGAGLATIPGTTITTSGGAISVTAPVSITGSPLFDTTNAGGTAAGANISFSNTLNGAASPTFRAGTGGITSFTGVVGGTVAPTNLTFTNPASHVTNEIRIGNNITVSGANPLTFPNLIPVTLIGTSTITSTGANVNFTTTVDGAQALTIAGGSGTVTFTGAVGGTTPLTSLATTAATITQSSTAKTTGALSYTGSIAINVNGNITTTGGAGGTVTMAGAGLATIPGTTITTSGGAISIANPVSLTGSPLFDSTNAGGTAAGANISFSNTLNGAASATIRTGTGGTLSFNAAVGGTTPLTSLTVTGGTITQGSTARTTGALSYTSSTATNVNGNVTTTGGVGGTVTMAGAGTVNIPGTTITTSGGAISMTAPVSITGSPLFDSTNAGGTAAGANISFSSTLNGAGSPTFRAGTGGIVSFNGAVGGTVPLTNLSFTSANQIQIGNNITVSGVNPLTFPSPIPVSLTGTSTITSTNANINFNSTVDGAQSLTVTGGSGTVTFAGAVGGTTPLTSLSVSGGVITQNSTVKTTGALSYTGLGIINVNGNVTTTGGVGGTVTMTAPTVNIPGTTITTSGGAILMAGPVSVTGSPLFDSTNAGGTAAGANITFSNTLNGAGSPTFRAGTGGIVSFNGAVGGTAALTNLTFTSANQIQIGNNITVSGANPLTFPSPIPVSITGTSTITSNNANINFNATLDGAQALTIAGGSGTVTFAGAIGGITPLASLSVTAGSIVQSSTARTTAGGLMYTANPITINGNIITAGGPITITGPVTTTATSFDTTNGGAVTIGANISLSSTLNGATNIAFSGGTGGTVSFGGAIGGTTSFNSLTATGLIINQSSSAKIVGAVNYTASTANNIGGNITTSGATIALNGPTNISNAPIFDSTNNGGSAGANISFSNRLNGATALTLKAGTGTVSLSGAVGGINPLTNLIFTNAGLIQIGDNITVTGSNSLNFPFAVSLTGDSIITSNNAAIAFSSTINGARTLQLAAGSGSITLSGAIGGVTPLTKLTIASANNATANAAITAGALAQSAGTGTTTFNGAIQTSGGLGVNVSGNAFTFNNTVTTTGGGGVSITNAGLLSLPTGSNFSVDDGFVQTGAGAVQLGNTINSTGSISFSSPITLTNATNISTSAANQTITFSSTIDSDSTPRNLTLSAGTSNIIVNGVIGGINPLATLFLNGADNINLRGTHANASTITGGTGTTTINGDIVVGAGGLNFSGNNLSVTGDVTSVGNVILNNTGTFTRVAGHTTAISGNFSLIGTGPVLGGSTITVGGDFTIAASVPSVTLISNAIINTSSAGSNITISSPVNGAFNLSIAAGTGDITFNADIGSQIPLSAITFSADDISTQGIHAASIVQSAGTGTTTFSGPLVTTGATGISINTNTIVRGAAITTTGGGPLTITNNGGSFTSTAAGAINLGGAFLQNGSGPVSFGGSLTTANANISFSSPIALASATSFLTGTGTGNIALGQTVQGAFDLLLDAGAGNITLSGAVGTAMTPLNSFTIARAANASTQAITALSISQSTGTGTTTFNGAVNATDAPGIVLTGSGFTFNNAFSTVMGGPLTVTNAGTLTFGAGFAGTVAGDFTQSGGGSTVLSRTITVDGVITLNNPLSVSGTGTLSTQATNQSIALSTVNGPGNLTLSSGSGPIAIAGITGGISPLTSLTISTVGNLTTQSVTASTLTQSNGTGTSVFNGDLLSGAGGINLNGAAFTLVGNATTTSGGVIAITNTGTLTTAPSETLTADGGFSQTGAGSISMGSNVTANNADISFAGPMTLTSNVTLDSGTTAGDITVDTVDGNFDLTFAAGRDIFAGIIGGMTPLGTVKATRVRDNHASSITAGAIVQEAGSGTTFLNGTITTSTPAGINLTGNNFSRAGGITTTNGGSFLVTNTGLISGTSINTTSIAGSYTQVGVGLLAAHDLAGTISANQGVSLSSPITLLSDPLNLTPIILDSSGGNGNITITGTIDNDAMPALGHTLILRSGAGNISLSGAVGSGTPLIGPFQLGNVNNFSAASIKVESIGQEMATTIVGAAVFNGPVITTGSSGISLSGDAFTFNNVTTTGGGGVAITNSGNLTINNGAVFSLTSGPFIQTGTGTVSLGGSITTANTAISFASRVTLTANGTLSTGGGNITLNSSLNGAFSLGLAAGIGTVTFNNIGNTTPLTAFTVSNASSIPSSGNINVAGPVSLTTSGALNLGGSVTTTTGGGTIALTNGGTLTITNPVTSSSSFIQSQSGTPTLLLNANITTNGSLQIASNIELTNPVSLNSNGGALQLSGTVDSDNVTPRDLTLASGSGNITLSSAIGGTFPLEDMVILSAANVTAANIAAASITQSTGTGLSHFTGTLSTTEIEGVSLTGNQFTLDDIVTTTSSGPLFISHTGLLTLSPLPAMGTHSLSGAFTESGGGAVSTGANTSTSNQPITFSDAVTLIGDTTLTSNNGNILFSSTIDGPFCLTTIAGTGTVEFQGAIGSLTNLGCLTASGSTIFQDSSVTTTGAVQETGAITLSGNIATAANNITLTGNVSVTSASTTLSTGAGGGGGTIHVTGTVNPTLSTNSLTCQTGSAGTITFDQAVGGSAPFTNFTATSGTINLNNFGSTSSGATGTTTLTAASNLNFTGTNYNNGTQIYTAGSTFNFTAGALTTITSSGSNIQFSTGSIQLGTSDLTINSNGGNVTLTDVFGAGDDLTIDAALGTVTVACIGTMADPLNSITITAATLIAPCAMYYPAITFIPTAPTLIGVNQLDPTNYFGPVQITANNILFSFSSCPGGNNVVFFSTLDSDMVGADRNIVFDMCGNTLTFNGTVGGTAPLSSITVNDDTGVNVNSSMTVGAYTQTTTRMGATTTFNNGITTVTNAGTGSTGDVTITAPNITLKGSLNIAGDTILDNSGSLLATGISAQTVGSFQQTGAGGVTLSGEIQTSDSLISINGATTLNGDLQLTTVNSTGADITFNAIVDGGFDLTFTAGGGDVTLSGDLGMMNPLDDVTFVSGNNVDMKSISATTITQLAGSGTFSVVGDFSTTGANGINLAGTNFFRMGSINTLNGGNFIVTNSGTITGSPGNTTNISGAYIQNGSTMNTINFAGTINADQGISFVGPIVLIADGELNTSGGGGLISLNNTVNGAFNFTLEAGSGNVNLASAIGTMTPLASLILSDLNNITASSISAGSIVQAPATSITGLVTFNGPLSTTTATGIVLTAPQFALNNDITTTSSGPLTLSESISLAFASGINVSVSGPFHQSGGGAVSLAGSLSASSITFDNAVTLSANTNLTTGTGNIVFSSTLNGNKTLDLTAGTGSITFGANVGSIAALGGLTIHSVNGITYPVVSAFSINQVANSGATTITGPVNTTTSTGMTFHGGTITQNGNIIANNSGTISFFNSGTLTIAAGTTTTAQGGYSQSGSSVNLGSSISTTNNPIAFGGSVALTNDVALFSGPTSGNITFTNPITGVQALSLNAGSGTITFNANVGPLTDFTINSAGIVSAQDISAVTITQQTGSISSTFENLTASGMGSLISLSGNTFNFNATITSGGSFTLTNTDLATFTAAATASIGTTFTQNGTGSVVLSNATTAGGSIMFSAPVSISVSASLDTSAANQPITFSDTLNGSGDLTLNSGTNDITFNSNAGFTTPLGVLEITNVGNFTAQGIQSSSFIQDAGSTLSLFGGDLTIGGGGITITGNALTFSGNITTTSNGPITLTNTGLLILSADKTISSNGAFLQNGSGNIDLGSQIIATHATALNPAIEFSGTSAITLTAPVQISSSIGGGDIKFSATNSVDGFQPMTLNAGTGNISILSNFGSMTPLGDFTIVSADDIVVQAITSSSMILESATGTSHLQGSLITNTAAGINLNGFRFVVESGATAITTTNSGSFTLTNQDEVNVSVPISINLDGALIQNGPGTVFLGSLTARQGVSCTGPIILPLNTTINTSTGSGNVIFTNRISTLAGKSLTITAGTGTITFTQPLGLTTNIGPHTVAPLSGLSAMGSVISVQNIGTSLAQGVTGTTALTSSNAINFTGTTYNANTQNYSATALFEMQAGSLTTFTSNGNPMTFSGANVLLSSGTDLTMTTGGSSLSLGTIRAPTNNLRHVVLNTGAASLQVGNLGAIGTREFATAAYTADNLTLGSQVADTFTFNYTGTLNAGGSIISTNTPLSFLNPVSVQSTATFSTASPTGANITFSSTVDGVASNGLNLTLNAGTGNILFMDNVGSTFPLPNLIIASANNVDLASPASMTVDALIQQSGTGTTTFNGPLTVSGSFGIMLTGNNFAMNDAITSMNDASMTVANSGTLSLSGTTMLSGSFSQTTSTGPVALSGSLFADQPITIAGPVTLSGSPVVDTSAANQTIHFLNTVGGSGNITLASGSGNIAFDANVGSSPSHIGAAVITSSHNLTAQSVFASSLNATSTGLATVNGTLSTNGVNGIVLDGNNFLLNGALITTNGGDVDVFNTGLITGLAISSRTVDGYYNQHGPGPVNFAGTLTTLTGPITFASPVTLLAAAVFDSSASSQNISFVNSINGPGGITLRAGNGDITLAQGLGKIVALSNCTIGSAHDVTINGVGTSFTGVAGTLSITCANDINFPNSVYSANTQSYSAGNDINLTAGSTTTLTSFGGPIQIPAGTLHLSANTNLKVITNNGAFSFVSIEGSTEEDITISTGTGTAALNTIFSPGIIHDLVVNAGRITLAGSIDPTNVSFESLTSISNVDIPEPIIVTGTASFNALSGNVGSFDSPILVQSAGQIFAGAGGVPDSLAAFRGTSSDNTVHEILTNPPCIIVFNNRILKNCSSNPFCNACSSEKIVWFVNSSNTFPGSGTYADPYSDLKYALTFPNSAPCDVIYVLPGTYDGFGTSFQLQDNQRLLGTTSEAFQRCTTSSCSMPILKNTGGGTVVRLANKNEVSGFVISPDPQSVNGFGIFGSGQISDALITNNSITSVNNGSCITLMNVPNLGQISVHDCDLLGSDVSNTKGVELRQCGNGTIEFFNNLCTGTTANTGLNTGLNIQETPGANSFSIHHNTFDFLSNTSGTALGVYIYNQSGEGDFRARIFNNLVNMSNNAHPGAGIACLNLFAATKFCLNIIDNRVITPDQVPGFMVWNAGRTSKLDFDDSNTGTIVINAPVPAVPILPPTFTPVIWSATDCE